MSKKKITMLYLGIAIFISAVIALGYKLIKKIK